MTEDQHIKLVKIGDEFWEELGKLVAKCAVQLPEEVEVEVIAYLQDTCSIYGTTYDKYLKVLREKQ